MFLDSASLRPIAVAQTSPGKGRVTLFTSFQASRYHPEAVRAVAEDSSVLEGFGLAFRNTIGAGASALLIDVQEMSPDDIRRLSAFVRTVASSFRSVRSAPVALVVPAGDTVGYPTSILARVADLIVIRITDEHRPGTRPGPLVTRDFVRRSIGARATSIGATRLGVEFPLYGYMWSRDGTARTITFSEANAVVLRESGTFRRDPASGFLTATGRDGSTIWVPDSRTVQTMVDAALDRGVRIVALAGLAGADPAIFARDSATR